MRINKRIGGQYYIYDNDRTFALIPADYYYNRQAVYLTTYYESLLNKELGTYEEIFCKTFEKKPNNAVRLTQQFVDFLRINE
jgi:hypothetical protein